MRTFSALVSTMGSCMARNDDDASTRRHATTQLRVSTRAYTHALAGQERERQGEREWHREQRSETSRFTSVKLERTRRMMRRDDTASGLELMTPTLTPTRMTSPGRSSDDASDLHCKCQRQW